MRHEIITGDCLATMRTMADASVDAIVTDPPAGISFMANGRKDHWDGDKGGRRQWIAWLAEVMTEALRVLKPGGHALVWALPRTSHWTGTALEDAGWQVRDIISHYFGSGFVKNHNVSKAIDRMHGVDRGSDYVPNNKNSNYGKGMGGGHTTTSDPPVSPDAIKWQGYGTALSPSHEVWYLARKPLDGTIASNVLKHGTGALNIAGCRVPSETITTSRNKSFGGETPNCLSGAKDAYVVSVNDSGRWPPNLLLTHAIECNATGRCVPWCPVAEMDRQSGTSPTGGLHSDAPSKSAFTGGKTIGAQHCDTGGASRFFPRFRYQAKPSTAEKDAGLDDLPKRSTGFPMRSADEDSASEGGDGSKTHRTSERRNVHPTIKSIALMRWLVRLITPPSGIVLDPFAGSGTTGIACVEEGVSFIGCEQSEEFAEIARHRLAHYAKQGRLF